MIFCVLALFTTNVLAHALLADVIIEMLQHVVLNVSSIPVWLQVGHDDVRIKDL